MANFTEVEKELLASINDTRIITSLSLIRESMEDIWNPEAPRVIRDFTDHGEKHCTRIANYLSLLLNANDGKKLSPSELYLLMAGVYLHDIGMQCDVVKHQDIYWRANSLGASFSMDINSELSSGFSLDEQIEIRKNHNYLSGAWIDYAFSSGNTILGKSIKTVPSELLDDLIDICLFHTKLSITNCPISFKYDQTGRKQLIASLLRFSDELDMESSRVSLTTVKTFSLNPKNELYWWLHERANIVFPSRNVINISVLLSKKDIELYGGIIKDVFVIGFQAKNKSLLSILARNGIPIVIDSESDIVENKRESDLPDEIGAAIKELEKKPSSAIQLASAVEKWLAAINYEIVGKSPNSNYVDIIASLNQGTVMQKVFIRCLSAKVKKTDVKNVSKMLSQNIPLGWIISDDRVTNGARDESANHQGLKTFSYSEFLRELIWGSYFDNLESLIESLKIVERYVDPGCYKISEYSDKSEIQKDVYSSLDQLVDDWLHEDDSAQFALLGEFGSGKTWFCLHYAYRQLQKYLSNPIDERLPILITLRNYTKVMTVKQLISNALIEQYKLPFLGGGYDVFYELNRDGGLLIILDGFDEMAQKSDYQTIVDNFWEIANLIRDRSKIILTSRLEYFREAEESKKILEGEESGRKDITIPKGPPAFELVYLRPFSEDKIFEKIKKRWGDDRSKKIVDAISSNNEILELARKPILVDLLFEALESVTTEKLVNISSVYKIATDRLIDRNIETGRTFTSTEDKTFFLHTLAWEMIVDNTLQIHYSEIPGKIQAYFKDKISDRHELDIWDFDLRNQTLLHRTAVGYYEFAHKSFAEYFAAAKLINSILNIEMKDVGRVFSLFEASSTLFKFASGLLDAKLYDQLKSIVFHIYEKKYGIFDWRIDDKLGENWNSIALQVFKDDRSELIKAKDVWQKKAFSRGKNEFEEYADKLDWHNYLYEFAENIFFTFSCFQTEMSNDRDVRIKTQQYVEDYRRGLLTHFEVIEMTLDAGGFVWGINGTDSIIKWFDRRILNIKD